MSQPTPTPIERYKRQFLEYLEIEKGRSLKTVENYDRYLTRFLRYSEVKTPAEINEDAVRAFRLWLNRQPVANKNSDEPATLKKKTQNYYLIALRSFLKYLLRREISTLSPERIELAKIPERSLKLITDAELVRLLEAPDGQDLKSLRDRALLQLLFSTGLRVSELCRLGRDLDLSGDELSIRGKGDKVRVVFLSPAAKEAVAEYLAKREDMSEYLFIPLGHRVRETAPGPLTPRSVERLIKHYAIKAGISKQVTPHTIRHSFATDLLRNGADLRSVQLLLGHSHINTTQIYTHLTDHQLREIHRKFHGGGADSSEE